MALGAITPVPITPESGTQAIPASVGNLKMTVTNVVGDSSYSTGGSALSAAQLGLSTVLAAQGELQASSGATNAGSVAYNTSTGKLLAFTNTGVEVTAAVNTSTATWQIVAFGY